jgi:hypothetical protein
MDYEEKEKPYGAFTWFAERIGVSRQTVYAWIDPVNGRMPNPTSLLLLRRMEMDRPVRKTTSMGDRK